MPDEIPDLVSSLDSIVIQLVIQWNRDRIRNLFHGADGNLLMNFVGPKRLGDVGIGVDRDPVSISFPGIRQIQNTVADILGDILDDLILSKLEIAC